MRREDVLRMVFPIDDMMESARTLPLKSPCHAFYLWESLARSRSKVTSQGPLSLGLHPVVFLLKHVTPRLFAVPLDYVIPPRRPATAIISGSMILRAGFSRMQAQAQQLVRRVQRGMHIPAPRHCGPHFCSTCSMPSLHLSLRSVRAALTALPLNTGNIIMTPALPVGEILLDGHSPPRGIHPDRMGVSLPLSSKRSGLVWSLGAISGLMLTLVSSALCAQVLRTPMARSELARELNGAAAEGDHAAHASTGDRTLAQPNIAPATDIRPQRKWILTYGPYNRHTGRGNYDSHPHFVTLEREGSNHWAYGASHFRNSFSQPCWFMHASRRFTFGGREDGFFVQVAGGIIYGYRSPHQDSVPLNVGGFNPALIPSFGYQLRDTAIHLAIYGKNAGQMLLFSYRFR